MEPEIPAPSIADVDVELLEYLQTLTPNERLELHQRALEMVEAVQAAGREFYRDSESPAPEAAR